MWWVIKSTRTGEYFAGINEDTLIASRGSASFAQRFDCRERAENFLADYDQAGYGLDSSEWAVVCLQ